MSVTTHPRLRRGHICGSFPSLKLGGPIAYHSTLARDLLYELEYDPTILHYQMASCAIAWWDERGRQQSTIPDFLVTRFTHQDLLVCLDGAAEHHERALLAGRQWAAAQGYGYVPITAADLRGGHRLANLKLLWRFRQTAIPPLAIARCLTLLATRPAGVPLGAVLRELPAADDPGLAPPGWVYYLLWQRVLLADLSQPLHAGTLVWLTPDPLRL